MRPKPALLDMSTAPSSLWPERAGQGQQEASSLLGRSPPPQAPGVLLRPQGETHPPEADSRSALGSRLDSLSQNQLLYLPSD